MNPPSTPLLIYDGECGFCRLWIDRWRHITGDRITYAPFQDVAAQFPEIPREQFAGAVHLIEPSGQVSRGAEAVFRALAYVPGWGWMPWIYRQFPGAAAIAEGVYRFVAAHRSGLYKVMRFFWGPRFDRPTYHLTRWIFLRLLALTYLLAFLSLSTQILGLVGSNGILPARESYPALISSDVALRVLCLGGAGLAALALVGLWPALLLIATWAGYLILLMIGQDFLAFQWDILLVETGFLAIWFAPGRAPSRAILWLLRFLLFRLTFSSGVVKLSSGDPTWRGLTALRYHYETQPLPTPIGWYFHQLPPWFQETSTVFVFGIELVVPFLIFFPRRLRFAGAAVMIMFQLLIVLTGNYAFFNLLTVALCLTLYDDALLARLVPARLAARLQAASRPRSRPARIVALVIAIVLLVAGLAQLGGLLWGFTSVPRPAAALYATLSSVHVISSYGLFAVMTTTRPEIVLQGSQDGQSWLDYEFKYKPGNLKRPPPIVAPHQPRLDWQMWFAALGNYQSNPWFESLMLRLLQASPAVLDLLETNPFPASPPRYVRAVIYDYHFTDLATKRRQGTWWRRELLRQYFPAVSLRPQASPPGQESPGR